MTKKSTIENTSLPTGWETKSLGEICEIQLGKTPHRKTERFWDKEKSTNNVWLSIADMVHGKSLSESKEYISDLGAANIKISPKGTLLVSFKLTLGRVSFADKDLYTNEAIASLLNLDGEIDKKYLFYYFTFFDWQKEAEGDVKVKGKTLNKTKLKALTLLVPSLSQQKQIVAILDKAFAAIDTAKENAEQNLQNAKELFESYLQNVFENKGDDWEEKPLGEVTSKIGSGATPRGGKASYKEEGISLIRSMNVHDFYFKKKNLAFIDDKQADALSNVTLQEKDVLLNITGASIARCCIIPKEYLPARVNQHVSIIRAKKDTINPVFLASLLTSKYFKDQILEIGEQGATRQAITKVQLENFHISYPKEIEEQEKVIQNINLIKAETKKLEAIYTQKLADLEEMKKSVLQKAFSGQLNTIN